MSLEPDGDTGRSLVRAGSQRIRLELEDLDEATRERAAAELREYPHVVEAAVRELRELLAAEKDLHVPANDENFLLRFLRPCKFYAKSAFEKIKFFYAFKRKYPAYVNSIPSKCRSSIDHGMISMQEIRDANGSRIVTLYHGTRWDTSKMNVGDVFQGIQVGLQLLMFEPRTQVGGVVIIVDLGGFSLSHALQVTPGNAKMIAEWFQDCIPARVKGIHLVNQPYIFNMAFAIAKPFLREKFRKRIHFHGKDFDSLKKHVPADALRKEYAGYMDLPEVPFHLVGDLLCTFDDMFEIEHKYGYEKKK